MEMLILIFIIFVLVIFVGVEIINKVLFILYMLLMSGINVILGIVVVGVIISFGGGE